MSKYNWETIDYKKLDYEKLTMEDVRELNEEDEKRKIALHIN